MNWKNLLPARPSSSVKKPDPVKLSVLFRKNKLVILFCIFALILVLIFMKNSGRSTLKSADSADLFQYSEVLTEELETLLSSMSGVGTCQVFITFRDGGEKVYAYDEDLSESSGDKVSENKQYVLVSSRSDGLILKVLSPEVSGVAVVCDGGDSARIKNDVTEVVSRTLGISADRISVKKRILQE